jgi:hypothetical protein
MEDGTCKSGCVLNRLRSDTVVQVIVGCGGWDARANFHSVKEGNDFIRELEGVPAWLLDLLGMLEENADVLDVKYYYRKMQP